PWHRDRWWLEAKGEVAVLVSVHCAREDALLAPHEPTERIGSLNVDAQRQIRGTAASDFDRPSVHFSHVLMRRDFERETCLPRVTRRRTSRPHLRGKLGALHLPVRLQRGHHVVSRESVLLPDRVAAFVDAILDLSHGEVAGDVPDAESCGGIWCAL